MSIIISLVALTLAILLGRRWYFKRKFLRLWPSCLKRETRISNRERGVGSIAGVKSSTLRMVAQAQAKRDLIALTLGTAPFVSWKGLCIAEQKLRTFMLACSGQANMDHQSWKTATNAILRAATTIGAVRSALTAPIGREPAHLASALQQLRFAQRLFGRRQDVAATEAALLAEGIATGQVTIDPTQ